MKVKWKCCQLTFLCDLSAKYQYEVPPEIIQFYDLQLQAMTDLVAEMRTHVEEMEDFHS